MPANWQLPPGVTRGMWEYFRNPEAARAYDAALADCPLLQHDVAFVRKHCQPAGSLLDLGCGTGRLALALASDGYRPLAIDFSAEMLHIVGEKAREAGLTVDRLQANLVELECLADQCFDHAACLFSTLGMIWGRDARQRFLGQVHRILKPRGRLVVHVHNRWFGLWSHAGRRLLARDLCRSLLGKQQPGDYVMPPHDGMGKLPMHLFTRKEIVGELHQAGFEIMDVQPISLRADGILCYPLLAGSLRAYGFLVAAKK